MEALDRPAGIRPDGARAVDDAFGQRLREALARRGIRKLYPLALEIGVDESALCRWRQGRPISLDNAVRLAMRRDVSLDWLLAGRGNLDEHRRSSPAASGSVGALVERLGQLPPAAIPPLLALLDALSVPRTS